LSLCRRLLSPTLFPYTTLFRSHSFIVFHDGWNGFAFLYRICAGVACTQVGKNFKMDVFVGADHWPDRRRPCKSRAERSAPTNTRSEEHTSELQSRFDLVCRLLL